MINVEKFPKYFLDKLDYNIDIEPLLDSRINVKWIEDSKLLPLTELHFGLYKIIHYRFHSLLGRFPNIVDGTSFNDKMQWLKLFDQSYDQIRCSDKILVKDYATERVGSSYILPAQQIFKNIEEILPDLLPKEFVIKANHDSGTVIVVRDRDAIDFDALKNRLAHSISKPYGWSDGEWAYRFVVPKIFIESLLNPARDASLADYKFFCGEGQVKFVHYIYDRNQSAKEIIVDSRGRRLDLSIHFPQGDVFNKTSEWDEMIWVAERLSCGFKFVRVDLYNHEGRIFVGELTFWPMCGMYQGDGQTRLGPLLDFCQRSTRAPILHELELRHWRADSVNPHRH
ncbi:hypothetical protein GU700_22720 [Methylobacterium sp. NI91]|nr:ATP-grasp fold amidoligase family protein [Methylobacterium sp. NI91]QIJ82040.1 hypothetical protein GU700_22720 [Methylobacterium sp. NI91]